MTATEGQPWLQGAVATPRGDVPRVVTRLTWQDHLGAARVRCAVGRMDYRVEPGLYAVGQPTELSQVVDRDACIECGACARNCPVTAITVQAGVGCATGIMQTALGMKSECCTDKQGCGCSPTKAGNEDRIPPDRLGVSGAAAAPTGCTPPPRPKRGETKT